MTTEQDFDDSFQGVEENIIEAIRLLGVNAVGLDPEATRREALDELAMALTKLNTGWESVREETAERENITSGDVEAKSAGPENVGSTDVKAEQAEKQPEAPSEPIFFRSQEELTEFVVTMWPKVNSRAQEIAQACSDAGMKTFKAEQKLKRELLSPGEIYCDEHFLTEAKESIEEILERLPDIEGDLVGEVNEAAIRAWSRLNMVLRWGTKDDEDDLDDSDNEGADSAQPAENSTNYVEHTPAQNGAAS